MLIQIILSILIGIILGIITGVIPGIHINLLLTIILSINLDIKTVYLLSFICSISITHTFIDFIPSVFLGCTEEEKSLLPGHELLKKGRGFEAVFLSSLGSLIGIIIISILSLPLIYFIPKINRILEKNIGYILIIILFILIAKEKEKTKSIFIIILSGALGLIVLNLNLREPLLPMLTGLFGLPLIIQSLKEKSIIPKQENFLRIPKEIIKPTFLATISSIICGFLPGLGTSQAAVLSTKICKTTKEEFILLVGATNTLVLITSFIALYSINKTRTGVAAAIQNIVPEFSIKILFLIIIVSLITGVVSFFITLLLTKKISEKIQKINYKLISIIVILIIITINLILGKLTGTLVLLISTGIGLYSNILNLRKSNMMACILIPTIYFYLTL